jgi:hypothetical protein
MPRIDQVGDQSVPEAGEGCVFCQGRITCFFFSLRLYGYVLRNITD